MQVSGELPLFELKDEKGGAGGTLEHWQRRDMLLALLHPACAECRALQRLLGERAAEWRKDEIAAVPVVMGAEGAEESFPGTLHDAEGRVSEAVARQLRLGRGAALLVVANRFGQVYAAVDVHGPPPDQVLAEALEWMDLAQRQCGECNPPLPWDPPGQP